MARASSGLFGEQLFCALYDANALSQIANATLLLQACFGAMSFGWDSSVIGGVIVLDPFQAYAAHI